MAAGSVLFGVTLRPTLRTSANGEFDAFVAARQGALLRTAFLLTGDRHRAEDLVQTALAKTWRAWRRIDRVESVEAYTRRTMVTTATSWGRRRWRGELATADLPDAPVRDGGEDGVDARLVMLAALMRLPPRQRAVVVLRYREDLSEAEVADLLGTSVGTVKSQASRALAKLRADQTLGAWAPTGRPR